MDTPHLSREVSGTRNSMTLNGSVSNNPFFQQGATRTAQVRNRFARDEWLRVKEEWLSANRCHIERVQADQANSEEYHISLTINCSQELGGSQFVYNAVPALRIHDAILELAGLIHYPANALMLVAPNGSQMYSYNLMSFYGLKNNDALILQKVGDYWFNQDKMIIRPEHADPAYDRVIDSLRGYSLNLLRENPPSEEETDMNIGTLYHTMAAILTGQYKEALFFDSRLVEFADQVDQSHIMEWNSPESSIFEIIFDDVVSVFPDMCLPLEEILARQEDTAHLRRCLQGKLADAFDMEPSKFDDLEITVGSMHVSVNAASWTLSDRKHVIDGATHLMMNFNAEVRIHPLFSSCKIDIALFDARGDKSNFSGANFLVGPPDNQKMYYQPSDKQGWKRFGLNVLSKFSDGDYWLHPFQHTKNWWRAYHGTGVSGMQGIVQGAHTSGVMRQSASGKLGPGVYVSPHLEYVAKSYTGIAKVDNKNIVMVFQCAVKPGEILREGYPGIDRYQDKPLLANIFRERRYGHDNSEWTFTSDNVRPYGVLLADADKLAKMYGGSVGKWK
jgi:hypothetical protein